jgi:threonine dehydratase
VDPTLTIDDIQAARRRLAGRAVRTPLLWSAPLSERVGRRTLVKFEGAQRTGSFKFRGAYNRLAALDAADRRRGVVAFSSGNHAQGVAAAAELLDIAAVVVMPDDAPPVKIERTRASGAEVVLYERGAESREALAGRIAADRGSVIVPSYDDPLVMAGQGTVGAEIVEQADELGTSIATIACCCGGGGLLAGLSTAVLAHDPNVAIWAVEPAGFDDTARSLVSGVREQVDADAQSICDALLVPTPGALTFPINQANLAGGLVVTDEEVRAAIRFAFVEMKLVVEPGGAVALAAALAGRVPNGDGDLAVVISGSNIDPGLFAAIVAG